jgi:hypothetical protein
MAFDTGSVVVPSVSDTRDISCPVTAFTRLDLPEFLLPKKPICTLSPEGVSFNPINNTSYKSRTCLSEQVLELIEK